MGSVCLSIWSSILATLPSPVGTWRYLCVKNLKTKNWVKDRPEGATCLDLAAITGCCGGKAMLRWRSRGSRWPPGSCKDILKQGVYLIIRNHFKKNMSNYGVHNITGTLLVSGSMDKGFLLLGQFFFLDRSLDRICLYFWIRSYST